MWKVFFVINAMKNQLISKTVIVTTLVVVAAAGALYFSSKVKRGPVAMKTYANDIYGLTFDYPATYDLTETSKREDEDGPGMVVTLTDKGVRIPKDGEGPTAITVGMYEHNTPRSPRTNPVETWIMTATSSNFKLSSLSKPEQTRIGEKDAWLYTWDGLYQGTSLVTENKGNIIMFTVTYDGETDMEKRQDFTKLIDSVRFYDATMTASTTIIQ